MHASRIQIQIMQGMKLNVGCEILDGISETLHKGEQQRMLVVNMHYMMMAKRRWSSRSITTSCDVCLLSCMPLMFLVRVKVLVHAVLKPTGEPAVSEDVEAAEPRQRSKEQS